MKNDVVFSPAFGNRPTYLVGRDLLMNSLEDGLKTPAGSRERSVVLLGQRGSGKTVVLWELSDRAAREGFAVASPTVASEGMLERVVEKLQDSGERLLRSGKAHISGGTLGALGFSVGLEFQRDVQETKSAEHRLTQLARAFSSKDVGMLILVDELQANSSDVRRLVIAYQELVGEGLNVALVMAGLPSAVSSTLNDHVLTFLNRAKKTALEPLRISDVDAFYEGAFAQMGMDVPGSEREVLAQSSKGSPYLMQLIGHNAVLRTGEDGRLTKGAAGRAIKDAVADFENDVCGTTLAALSGRDCDFLVAMSEDEGPSPVASVAERMGVTLDYAQKYRRRLIDAGVIRPARRGYVEFAVPYLRDYLSGRN